MDGRTLRAGAVAAVQGYGRAITLARKVMEETPHVLLVGRGAERLAAEIGELPADQHTAEAMRRWEERFAERGLTPDGHGQPARGGPPADPARKPAGQDLQDRPRRHAGHGQLSCPGRPRRPGLRGQHQRPGLEISRARRRQPPDRRRQLLRQPLRRRRLHRHGRAGHPRQHGAQPGALSENGHVAARGRPGDAPRSALPGRKGRPVHEHRRADAGRRVRRLHDRAGKTVSVHDGGHGRRLPSPDRIGLES